MKKFVVVLLVLWILLTGCRANPELDIEEYLKQNYGTEEFTFERIEGTSPISYDVFFHEWPDIHFTLTRTGYAIRDDYVDKVIEAQMESLGLSWQIRERDNHILIYYKDYEAIDDIAGKIVEFVNVCEETEAFKAVSENYMLLILPEEIVDPFYPGYKVCFSDGFDNSLEYKGPNKYFYMKEEFLESEKLAAEIRLCHIYYQYQFTTNQDEAGFIAADMERYYDLVSGVTGKAADRTETVYPGADILYTKIFFGSAYQILSADGLVTDVGENRFTATANGTTVEFMIAFERYGPVSSCLVIDNEADAIDQGDEQSVDWNEELRAAVELLTGKSFSDTTPEKKVKAAAAKEEEKRLARIPVVEGYFANASNVGEAALVHNLEITVLSANVTSIIKNDYMQYIVKDGKEWVLVRIRAENKGSQSARLFDYFMTSEDYYSANIADREGNLYQAGDVLMAKFDDIYTTIPAGESAEGNVLFEIPEGLSAHPENLVFVMFNQRNQKASFLLPEKIDGK